MNRFPPDRVRKQGFTFVETLMALSIAAGVITVAVLGYQAVTQLTSRAGSYGTVQLPIGIMNNFYGQGGSTVDAYFAPSYGRVAMAEILRSKFYEDIGEASAVFCLGRNLRTSTTQRPSVIPIAANFDPRRLDTPDGFRNLLASAVPATDGYFRNSRGAFDSAALSIFILRPYSATQLGVQAIYEVDFVSASSPVGTYASVRRYQAGVCTNYYDVFYPASDQTVPFLPLAAFFERRSRWAKLEGAPDLFKVAANRPFYMVWWPDPAAGSLEAASEASFPSSEPRSQYGAMTDRTSFNLVFPMFPAL